MMGNSFKDMMKIYHDSANPSVEQNESLSRDYKNTVSEKVDEHGNQVFENLSKYTTPVKQMERPLIGRDKEMQQVLAAMMRPELCNVILLGEAGSGKSALVQGLSKLDTDRSYLEIDLSKMIADVKDTTQLGDKLKQLFTEVQRFREENDVEIVLFMDEFHQIVQLSASAVEALKPLLADSGTRGVRVIAATTYIEFRDFIQPNQPLVERLQRINLAAPDEYTVVQILRGLAVRYKVDAYTSDYLFRQIYELTNRYIPANSQPRKSILVLDSMIGWHRLKKRKMDMNLLADVIYESEGVKTTIDIDAAHIKDELDKHVFAQQYATAMLEQRLQVCVADLNNKSKPMMSMLFTGSTGVGKTEISKQLAKILFDDERRLIRFDMTEFANPDSLDLFRSELTNKIWARPFSIILLDEIEKACSPVTRLLLQVLDDGRLMDENNREVVFTNAYIIMTTNAGSEIYKDIQSYQSSDTGDGKNLFKYERLIRKSISGTTGDNRFPPELLGRIDCIVPFQPFVTADAGAYCTNKIREID